MLAVLHDPRVLREQVVRHAEEAAREGKGRGIVSLCTDPLNKLMWTHYADNHCGFCLEYRRDGCQILAGELCQPVLYRDRYPTLRASDVLSLRPKQTFLDLLRTKSTDWEYEREWRVVWPEGDKAIGPLQVTGVILGLRTPEDTLKAVRSWAGQIEGIRFGHVRQIDKTFHTKVEWE